MIGKLLLVFGILLILSAPIVMVWGIHSSFVAMDLPESAGIGGVVNGLRVAFGSVFVAIIGIILALIGGVKLYRDSKKNGIAQSSLSGIEGN